MREGGGEGTTRSTQEGAWWRGEGRETTSQLILTTKPSMLVGLRSSGQLCKMSHGARSRSSGSGHTDNGREQSTSPVGMAGKGSTPDHPSQHTTLRMGGRITSHPCMYVLAWVARMGGYVSAPE